MFFFIIAFNSISLLSPFSLLPLLNSFFPFSFYVKLVWRLFLALPLLWNHRILKVGVDRLYCVSFSSFLFMPFPCLLLLWRSPMRLYLLSAVMLRFSHPFFNLLCVFSQSLLRNQRSKRRRFCPMRPILVSLFPLFFFFTASPLFFLTKSVSPFFVSCCLGF